MKKKTLKVKARYQNETMLKIHCKWIINWGKCCDNRLAKYPEYEYFDCQALLKIQLTIQLINVKCMQKCSLDVLPLLSIDWPDLQKKLLEKVSSGTHKHNKKENTLFWKKGFDILQNIQDRDTLQKHVRHARDPISMVTVNEKSDEKKKLSKWTRDTETKQC